MCKWRIRGHYKVIKWSLAIFLSLVQNLICKWINFEMSDMEEAMRAAGSSFAEHLSVYLSIYSSRLCGFYNATSSLFWSEFCAVAVLFMWPFLYVERTGGVCCRHDVGCLLASLVTGFKHMIEFSLQFS